MISYLCLRLNLINRLGLFHSHMCRYLRSEKKEGRIIKHFVTFRIIIYNSQCTRQMSLHSLWPTKTRHYLSQCWLRSMSPYVTSCDIWWHRPGSTLAQVMPCCLMAITGSHSEGNPPMIGGFPSQRASNVESVYTSWSHHGPFVHKCNNQKIACVRCFCHSFIKWGSSDNTFPTATKRYITKDASKRNKCMFCGPYLDLQNHTREIT